MHGRTKATSPMSMVKLPVSIVQVDESKEWASALSTVRPITHTQNFSWGQRVVDRVKQSSSSLYRL